MGIQDKYNISHIYFENKYTHAKENFNWFRAGGSSGTTWDILSNDTKSSIVSVTAAVVLSFQVKKNIIIVILVV